jgi:hypothetical protein
MLKLGVANPNIIKNNIINPPMMDIRDLHNVKGVGRT